MRKITPPQVAAFGVLFTAIIALAVGTSWFALGSMPLGSFHGTTVASAAIALVYIYALVVYRLFLRFMPLQLGELPPGSRAEFAAQVHFLFYLMIFNSLIRTHFVPIPIMRLVYLALGAKLGRDTYSAGALLDPPLTQIGDNCIVGHDAVIFAHVIEGDRFELFTVRIGSGVTIGGHAAIMPDVEIGDGAIISIGAVVTKGTRIGSGEVWGGVPARRIATREDAPAPGPTRPTSTTMLGQ
jgi:acetyltransferase-like isoleucine patch superfamily enzyme